MILKDEGEIESEYESDNDYMPSLKYCINAKNEYTVNCEFLVVRYVFRLNKSIEQKENIFHTRCNANRMICILYH